MWVFHRSSIEARWGPAENLGQPVNSMAADYCPTPLRGKWLLFVSTRPGGCCGGDMYLARNDPAHGWSVEHLGCAVDGSAEFPGWRVGPSLVETAEGTLLKFSSDGFDVGGGQDVYGATHARTRDPWSAPVNLRSVVNTGGNETRSSLSWDGRRLHFGRDGEIFVSTR